MFYIKVQQAGEWKMEQLCCSSLGGPTNKIAAIPECTLELWINFQVLISVII